MKVSTQLIRYTVIAVASLLGLIGCGDQSATPPGAAPPMRVDVVTLTAADVELTTQLPGRAVAFRKAEVRPQVTGIIQQRLFEEGSEVEAGEQLYQIDAARYEAAVQTAEAGVQRAQANFSVARDRFERYRGLLRQKAISQQNFDDAEATFKQTQAELALAEAELKTARIDLDYTRVVAPIGGRIGKSSVTEGALVTAQQAAVLATIHQLDPIYVDLAQPTREIIDLRRQLSAGTLARDGSAQVRLRFEDGQAYTHPGQLRFAEMTVEASTGTVAVRAEFPNPDHLLLPGMFVRAEIAQGTRAQALRVPQRAVSRGRTGEAQVMVVGPDNKVAARTVTLGAATGNQWLVEDGLRAGERVIVAGLQKVGAGATVEPVELTTESITQAP